ncbi:MAG TPA: hypothetical protein VMT00_14445 [Thermoanaerobaculia bacterium]|nr:hypothetical protein [Thermoanaerobaculia bacterium]
MNATFAVAAREVRGRANVFVAAGAAAILPFFAPLLPGMSFWGAGVSIGFFGAILGAAFAFGLAIMLGASTVGRDLSDGHLSFYFSKPLSVSSIWFGKAAGSLVLVLGTFALIGLPSGAMSQGAWRTFWTLDVGSFAGLVLCGSIVLFLASHSIGTMLRSRSPLVAADLALALLTLGIILLILRRLILGDAVTLMVIVGVSLAVAVALSMALAPVWQLARGRTDARRSHAALSGALWVMVATALLLAGLYVAWLTSATPRDLTTQVESESGSSGWLFLAGKVRSHGDYRAGFFVHPGDGRWVRLSGPPRDLAFSRDGSVAAWTQPLRAWSPDAGHELYVCRLDAGERPVGTGLPGTRTFVLSDDGTRVAQFADGLLTVHDIGSASMLASARVPVDDARVQMYFRSADVVRVISWPDIVQNTPREVQVDIFELDVTRRSLRQTGKHRITARQLSFVTTRDGSQMLVRAFGEKVRLVVVDGASGEMLREVTGVSGPLFASTILDDGTIASGVTSSEGSRLVLFPPQRDSIVAMRFPPDHTIWPIAEVAPGKLLLSQVWRETNGLSIDSVVVDLQNRRIDRSLRTRSIPYFGYWNADPRTPRLSAEALPRLDVKGKPVVWNTVTGEVKPLPGR